MRDYREVAVRDDDTGFEAYLVVDASDQAISFGGTRIDLSVTREMVVALAENMSLKFAGHGSPVGGAKAGLRASPDDPRLKRFLALFAEACHELLSSTTILGKDMGAKQWMLDEIYATLKMPQLGVARKHGHTTRCPDRLGDLDGYRKNMTGQGVFWAIEQALGNRLLGVRVLIQGFGVVGSGLAWHLDRAGATIVGVSDREKAVLRSDGFDIGDLEASKDDSGLIVGNRLPGAHVLADRDQLLAHEADVLVLAAGSNLVDGALAARIQTPLVVEAANLALLPEARRVLHASRVRVVPDVVAGSSSAAFVGHQIASGNTRDPAIVWAEIEASIRSNTDAVERTSKQLDIDPKEAFRHLTRACTSPEQAVRL